MTTNKERSASEYFASWGIIMRTRRVLYILREKRLKKLVNLDPKQVGILVYAVEAPGISPAEVARAFLRDHHTIWVQLQVLVKKGMVTLQKNPKCKNRLMIHATEKGVDTYKKALDYDFFKELYDPLTHEEYEELDELLQKLYQPNEDKLLSEKQLKT